METPQRAPVIATLVERFRSSPPMSREERQRRQEPQQVYKQFWWMDRSPRSLVSPISSISADTPASHKNSVQVVTKTVATINDKPVELVSSSTVDDTALQTDLTLSDSLRAASPIHDHSTQTQTMPSEFPSTDLEDTVIQSSTSSSAETSSSSDSCPMSPLYTSDSDSSDSSDMLSLDETVEATMRKLRTRYRTEPNLFFASDLLSSTQTESSDDYDFLGGRNSDADILRKSLRSSDSSSSSSPSVSPTPTTIVQQESPQPPASSQRPPPSPSPSPPSLQTSLPRRTVPQSGSSPKTPPYLQRTFSAEDQSIVNGLIGQV